MLWWCFGISFGSCVYLQRQEFCVADYQWVHPDESPIKVETYGGVILVPNVSLDVDNFKVNIDANIFEEECKFGFDGVIRDHHNFVVAGISGLKEGVMLPEVVEVVALKFVVLRGCCRLQVLWKIANIFLNSLVNVSLNFVKRFAN
uniref:Uncharacterized protein n=1 Tax=Cannabis sativa TaxID=3483 RepID=A0A803NG61_CANSA